MKREKYKFVQKMKCQKCGKEIQLKGNRKYCKKCAKEVTRGKDKLRRINNPEKTKEEKRIYYLRHRKQCNEKSKKWYEDYKEKHGISIAKIFSEQNRFGGNRLKAVERDNYTCQICNSKKLICVHHIDKTGRSVDDNHNNDLKNLITLCRKCHMNVHREDLQNGKRT